MDSNQRPRAYESPAPIRLVNKLTVTQLAELTNLSKSFISQVKNGKKRPSKKLLSILADFQRKRNRTERNYLTLFLQSRQCSETSNNTIHFYKDKLGKFVSEVNIDKARPQDIERFLLQFDNTGNRHAYFRAIRTLYNWREVAFNLPNPIERLKAPRMGKLILPSLTAEVNNLLKETKSIRDKAIIALLTESGLRLSDN